MRCVFFTLADGALLSYLFLIGWERKALTLNTNRYLILP